MDDAGAMRGGEPIAGLHERRDDLAPRVRLLEPRRERRAAHELHDDEDLAVDRADLVDRHDIGMRELGHRLGLAHQPHAGRRAGVAVAHDLDRDVAIEVGIVGLEHDAHAAGAELADDPEVLERRAGREPWRRRGGMVGRVLERLVHHRRRFYYVRPSRRTP